MMAQVDQKRPAFLEPHYTLTELATAWHVSRKHVRDWFVNEPGVIKWGQPEKPIRGRKRKRTLTSIRIPESVALRVYKFRTGSPFTRT